MLILNKQALKEALIAKKDALNVASSMIKTIVHSIKTRQKQIDFGKIAEHITNH